MVGLASIALDTGPILGGALVGIAAGQLRAPDVRKAIKQDMELLEKLPEDQVGRREALRRSIHSRIRDLVAADEKKRQLRSAATSYEGNWRDIVVFICAVLFTVVWWNVNHSKSNWLVVFIVMIVASAMAAVFAFRGLRRAMLAALYRNKRPRHPHE